MLRKLFIFLLTLSALSCFSETTEWTPKNLPMPYLKDKTQHVCNPEQILSQAATDSINNMLTVLEEKRGVQAIVVVVGHVENADAYRFGMDLAEHYGIGSKEQNSGLLIVLATKDRKYQILTGTGLEGTLPDAICRRVENRLMVPALKRGDWDEAMFTSVKALSTYCMGDKSLVNSNGDLDEDELSQLLGIIIFGFCTFLGAIYVVVNALRTRRTCPQCRNSKLKVVKTRIERGKDKHLYKVFSYRCKKCGYEDEKKYSLARNQAHLRNVGPYSFGSGWGRGFSGGGGFGGGGSFGGGSFGGGGSGGSF